MSLTFVTTSLLQSSFIYLNYWRLYCSPLHFPCFKSHSRRQLIWFPACNLILSNYMFDYFHQLNQVDVIYTDFAKSFDRINHFLLIDTIDLLSWLCNNKLLSWAVWLTTQTFGVPQGSILFPHTFFFIC